MYHVSSQGVDERMINVHYDDDYYWLVACGTYNVCLQTLARAQTDFANHSSLAPRFTHFGLYPSPVPADTVWRSAPCASCTICSGLHNIADDCRS